MNIKEERKITLRIIKDFFFKVVVGVISITSILPLFLILFYIIKRGISSISWNFLTNLPKPVGEIGGGISNAIVGTILLVLVACVISIPLGVLVGLYISEEKKGRLAAVVSLCAESLQSIPSIVIGIIAYIWIVKPMGHFSAFSGSVALALMMLPIVVKAAEETLLLLPDTLKEASLALGVPYYKTVLKVILPAGFSGIMTGILLGVARIAGETAPLLFTAFGNPFMNLNILKPVHSLPLLIFTYAISPYEEWQKLAWGASLVLIFLVLLLNLISKVIVRRWKIQF
ncbi:MAG: phosphate ABC transporter permease PstA [Candidatus Schekmanbacteria bacterium]|nr:MAG: phosphate ABC transporter permease PstA [Candidatus Schekmanbacteria bacterium]